MNRRFLAFALTAVAGSIAGANPATAGLDTLLVDGFEAGDSCAWGAGPETCPGFSMVTPPTEVAAGTVATRCYYIHTGNADAMGVRRFVSSKDSYVLHFALYTTHTSDGTPIDLQPPGTLADCTSEFGGQFTRHVYMSNEDEEELLFPPDDGEGSPLGFELLAEQPAVLVLRILNPTDDPVNASVALTAFAHPPAVDYTRTAAFATFNSNINVPPMGIGWPETFSCPVPAGAKFWWFSTHTHSFAVEAKLQNASTILLTTTDWESPAVQTYDPPSFYEFGPAETLTYTCTYNNPLNQTVNTGESFLTEEHCMALAYFFPATVPRFCFNNILIP